MIYDTQIHIWDHFFLDEVGGKSPPTVRKKSQRLASQVMSDLYVRDIPRLSGKLMGFHVVVLCSWKTKLLLHFQCLEMLKDFFCMKYSSF